MRFHALNFIRALSPSVACAKLLVKKRIADGLYNLLFSDRAGIAEIAKAKKPEFQLSFSFWEEFG